ncbi:NUDIX domain-containing protein [Knoellia remsis]|uniref:NUDIX domain-containing protein n=1 Tax=Knoellia remsis TaxID=407159 RepID=A0A2T0TTT6_9MICO|nr:NUDIX domain-containing protein [Knoellia remsis]
MLLIDPPAWPAHGRLWSHLVSDTSIAELHAFAERAGLPRRGFEGDHYDVPEERYAAVVAAGAQPTEARELVRRLRASGLRLTKRKGDRGLAKVTPVDFPDGTTAEVDLIASSRPADADRVFAAMVFVRDAAGDFVVVHSRRRDEWGAPGGWREGEEPVVENALREVREECGLVLTGEALAPVAYERFRQIGGGAGLWRPGQDLLQVYAANVDGVRPALTAQLDDTTDRRWVTPDELRALCGHLFWWPVAEHVIETR